MAAGPPFDCGSCPAGEANATFVSAYYNAQKQAYLQSGSAGWFIWSYKVCNEAVRTMLVTRGGVGQLRSSVNPTITAGGYVSEASRTQMACFPAGPQFQAFVECALMEGDTAILPY